METSIKQLRLRAGMTQKEFAEYFEIPKRTIEDWEHGKREIACYLRNLIEYKLRKEHKFMLSYHYAKTEDYDCVLVVDTNGDAIVLHDGVNFENPLSKETAIEELIEDQPNNLTRCQNVHEVIHSIGVDFEVFRFDEIKGEFDSLEEF